MIEEKKRIVSAEIYCLRSQGFSHHTNLENLPSGFFWVFFFTFLSIFTQNIDN